MKDHLIDVNYYDYIIIKIITLHYYMDQTVFYNGAIILRSI